MLSHQCWISEFEVEWDVFSSFDFDEFFIFISWVGDMNKVEVLWDLSNCLFKIELIIFGWLLFGKTICESFWTTFELNKSRSIWDSSVGNINLLVFVIDEILSPSLPLFLSSNLNWCVLELDESRGVWDSGVGNINLLVFVVDKILGPSLPLLFSSDLNWCVLELKKSRLIWNSGVCDIDLFIFIVDKILSPSLPLLFSSNLNWCIHVFGIELNSREIWDSGISNLSLLVFEVDKILSPSLPLLFSSDLNWCIFELDQVFFSEFLF